MSEWATLAIVAALAVEKLLLRCNVYDNVKTLHCQASECCQFDVRRNTPASSPKALTPPGALTPAQQSGSQSPQLRPIPAPNSLADLIALSQKLSSAEPAAPPTVQRMD